MNNSLYLYDTKTSYLPSQTTEPPRAFTKDIVIQGWHSPTQRGIKARKAINEVTPIPEEYTQAPSNLKYNAAAVNAPDDIEVNPDNLKNNLQRIGVRNGR